MDSLSFTVYGTPKPAGSKRGFMVGGKVRITDANPKSRSWKNQVAQVAGETMANREIFDGPLIVTMRFYSLRPKGHYKASGGLSAKGRRTPYPAIRPDVLKLARGVEDALTGVCYRDDAQIVGEKLYKRYGEPERVEIVIEEMG